VDFKKLLKKAPIKFHVSTRGNSGTGGKMHSSKSVPEEKIAYKSKETRLQLVGRVSLDFTKFIV
jgi:hypothetical protein